jgi:hypothetical protein
MDPRKPITSHSLAAREAQSATCRTPGKRLAILASVLMLLVALAGCAATSTSATTVATYLPGTASPTAGGAPDSDKPTPTPTHAITPTSTLAHAPTATPTHVPTATPTPMKPSIHEVAHTTTLYGGSTDPATATCPSGERALGGGWNAPPQGARVFAATLSGSSWAVSVVPLGHPAKTSVTAYVECLRGSPTAVVTLSPVAVSVPASSFNGGTVSCASMGTLVGWGFAFSATSSIELTASLAEINGWTLEFVNHGGADLVGSLVAVCLSNVTVSANKVNSPKVHVPIGTTGGNQVSCPLGTASAGGFQYSSGGGGNLYLLHATSTGWQVAAYAVTNSIDFNVWVMCLHVQ